MFKVIDKTTGEVFTVYGLNGTHFLIYNTELDWWHYKPINECRPYAPQDKADWLLEGEIFG